MPLALPPNALQAADSAYRRYVVVLPSGHTLDDALKPAYWAHVAPMMLKLSDVRITLYDESACMDAIVCDSGKGYARLKELRRIDLTADASEADGDDEIVVRYGNIQTRWQIIRKSDGCVLKEGIRDKGDAQREALDFERKLAA